MPEEKEKIKVLSDNLFPVVGVGASAGGLEAFKILVRSIPPNSGMAYILVQHLLPTHISSLPEILQRETVIPVLEIIDNVQVHPDHIYIIPSNKMLEASDGLLMLSPRPPSNEKNMPIDLFLSSLAEVHQSQAIGVILSGTGMDGTMGLRNIKNNGGITIAQEPSTSAYDAMPLSAINAEVVDFILAPDKIPDQLMKLSKAYNKISGNAVSEISEEESFKQILSLLRVRKGVDFTYYKQTTIRRRILRRMVISKIEKLSDYLKQLKENKNEQDILFQDLLIPVTSFFRDDKSFDILCETVFPELLKGKTSTNPLRIWVAGCSTGEEAYSIGMCLYEYLGEKSSNLKIQIFATDISETAITKARSATYNKKDLEGVSESRLKQFFTKIDGSYQVKKNIRDMLVFAIHNFLKDPPFARLDLVSCRNVLIYLEPFLQKRAFSTFHYSLREKGFLMLGKSESPGSASELFIPFGKRDKIYTRKTVPGRFVSIPPELSEHNISSQEKSGNISLGRKDDFHQNADEILLSKYTPVSVIVNEQYDIVQFRGSTGDYLEPSPGKASLNVLKMAKEGLSFEIRNALLKSKTSKETFIKENIPLAKGKRLVTLEVVPLLNSVDPHYLILFRDSQKEIKTAKGKGKAVIKSKKANDESGRIKQLEKDLAQAREDMRSITEDQEASNEELLSANEELLSGSEELQSLNEELETSKEELQSTNEELITLNQELFDRNEQYNQARIYSEAIITTIHEPLLVLDSHLRIKSANPAFYKAFHLTEEEVTEKLLFSLQNGEWDTGGFREHLAKLKKDNANFIEWQDTYTFSVTGTMILSINVQPIRRDNGDNLILVAIDDITTRRAAEEQIKLFSEGLEKQVQERTVSLKSTNIELEHSNKNLEQFASIASHDLQEPLRKIQTFAALLNLRHSKETSDEAKALLQKIVTSSERMAALIQDVLNFSRISHQEIAFTQTDVNFILNNVLKDFDLLIEEKKAKITKDELPVIEAIPLQINQLFYNLLSNSLKFSKKETPPEIHISSHIPTHQEIKKYPELNPGISYCEIKFSDNGLGFDQQFAGQVFQIFERLHNKAIYAGNGIGLALCEKIVLNHHGYIRVESKENKGTTFYIILPLQQPVTPIHENK